MDKKLKCQLSVPAGAFTVPGALAFCHTCFVSFSFQSVKSFLILRSQALGRKSLVMFGGGKDDSLELQLLSHFGKSGKS